MPGKKILINGSTAYDLLLSHGGKFTDVITPKSLENLSAAFLTPRLVRHHGGTGANIAWNLTLLGGSPLLVSTVGTDGGTYTALLSERGVPVEHIEKIEDELTATAIIATDTDAHQLIFFHPGADAKGSFPDLSDDREDIAYAIMSPRDAGLMLKGAAWCAGQRIPYFFDPGQQIGALGIDELRHAVSASKGVIVNEFEWSLLKEKLSTDTHNFYQLSPLLLITQAEKGVLIVKEGSEVQVAGCTADHVINPTGAGDAFRAGLLHGLSLEWETEAAAQLGCALASFVVEIEGTLLDTLDMDHLRERASNAYGTDLPEF